MKKILILVCIMCIVILKSCKKVEWIEVDGQIKQAEEMVEKEKRGQGHVINRVGAEDAERLNVSKKLVWVTTYGAGHLDPKVISRFNEVLVNKYGCDFVVEFQYYDTITFDVLKNETGYVVRDKAYPYGAAVRDMMEIGQQVDILYSGMGGEYDSMVETGMYVPLKKLMQMEEGSKLYEAYPEAVWERVERNDEIYGYTTRNEAVSWYALWANSDMVNNLEIDLKEGYSFYDLERILEQVEIPESEKLADKILPIFVSSGAALIRMEGYYNIDPQTDVENAIYFKYNKENGTWIAVNAAKEDMLIRQWKTVKEYRDKGWFYISYTSEFAELIERENYIFMCGLGRDGAIVNDKFNYNDSIQDIILGDTWYDANFKLLNSITGIASWSEYKEEAFRLITLLNTEPELSNLIEYGIEGVHYTYENNIITALTYVVDGENKKSEYPKILTDIGNRNLLLATGIEPEKKLEYYKELNTNFPKSPSMLSDIDLSGYEEQLKTISTIYNQYLNNFYLGQYDDVEAAVAEMNAKLEEVGITQIINYINKQLKK